MWQKIARIILRKKLYLTIIVSAITIFLGIEALKLRMDYGYARMLSEKDEVYVQNKKFKQIFGEEANAIAVGIHDENLFNIENFKHFQKLNADIRKHKDVVNTFSICNAINLRPITITDEETGRKKRTFESYQIFPDNIRTQADLDSIKDVFFNLPFYENLLYNKENGVYLFTITLDNNILNSSKRQKSVAELVKILDQYSEETGIDIHISGHPYIRTAVTNLIKNELLIFTLLAAFICIVILYIFFKSFKIIFAALIVISLSLIWTFGYMVLFGYKVTILTSMIPPLLIVIGVPNIIYMMNKYHAEVKNHGNKIMAMQRTICRIGNASFVTNLTTACGFATFIITSNKLLIEFGVTASLGIMTVFLLTLIIIPSFFSECAVPSTKSIKHLDNKIINKIIDKIQGVITNKRPWVYTAFATLVVVMIGGIFLMHRTGYILDDVPKKNKLYVDTKFLEQNFSGVSPLEIAIFTKDTLNGQDLVDQLVKIDTLQTRLREYPELSRSMSVVDAVKFLYQAHSRGKVENYRLPTDLGTYQTLIERMPNLGNKGLASAFIDSSHTVTRVSMNIEDIGCDGMAQILPKINADLNEIFPPENYETIVTGTSVMNFTGTTYLINNLLVSLFLAIIVIAIFLLVMFRSWKITLLSLIPNMIPMIVTAGVMGYFGIPIKASTILVFSIAFGISVDDTIHFLAKYNQEIKRNGYNIGGAVREALSETGYSMLYTSTILILGFGIFAFSRFGGTVSLGILVSTALFIATFANIILLPSLLLTLEHHFNLKIYKEPYFQIYNEEDEIDLDELKIEGEEYSEYDELGEESQSQNEDSEGEDKDSNDINDEEK